jgi:DNA-binding response OmpR family regulator
MAILVVEDEADLSDIVTFILQRAGHTVIKATSGESGLRLWREYDPDLVLLDVGLPGMSGWDVCRIIRSDNATPVVFLTGHEEDECVVQGLELGAEDYITKPFSPKVLKARIDAVLRRHHQPAIETMKAPATARNLTLDAEQLAVSFVDDRAHLTPIEFRMLQSLVDKTDRVVPYTDIISAVWGFVDDAGSKLLKGHVRNLRSKLSEIGFPGAIESISGIGYILKLSSGKEKTAV